MEVPRRVRRGFWRLKTCLVIVLEASWKLLEALGSSWEFWEAVGKLWEALGSSWKLWEALGKLLEAVGKLWEGLGSSTPTLGAL